MHISICQVNWSKRAKFVLAWVFKLTFKESAKSKKVGLHRFETRIGMEVPVNDKKDSWIWIIKSILFINKKTLLNILDSSYVKLWKGNLRFYIWNYVLPSDWTLKIGLSTYNWKLMPEQVWTFWPVCLAKKNVHNYSTALMKEVYFSIVFLWIRFSEKKFSINGL